MNTEPAQPSGTDQEAHDREAAKLSRSEIETLAKNLAELARSKGLADSTAGIASASSSSAGYDAIERAMQKHPSLTREKAQEMADAFGY